MRSKLVFGSMILLAMTAHVFADAYSSLLQRYELQIKQQERHMRNLRRNLQQKEQEAKNWQRKAESAKTLWAQAGQAVSTARRMVKEHQNRRIQARSLAEAAQWAVLEQTSLQNAADLEMTFWTIEAYKRQQTPRYFQDVEKASSGYDALLMGLSSLAANTHELAEAAQQKENSLRAQEFRWQNEEQKQARALDRSRSEQQAIWLRWQEALRRRESLEEERAQLEQSAQALRVMLNELRSHRDQALALRSNTPQKSAALNALKGTLPWPAIGMVTQNFGKQYSDKMQQLIISNGIKLEAETGQSVRAIQPGKVLFARPFQQYGQLVIIQHQNGLTSVYGGLGQTQVKESDVLATLDPIGTVGESRSFYFELRHEEQPINPLVWLEPRRTELSSRTH